MIGDGMGYEQVEAGSYLLGDALSFESFVQQAEMTTYSADSTVTDSAASGTAMATGTKVNNGVVSMAYPGDGSELATSLEVQRDLGKMTGLVTTTFMTHATPATFGSHEPSRTNYGQIADDYLNQTRPNVLFGGGANGLTVESAGGAGYTVVTTEAEMDALDTEAITYVSGQFGDTHLPYEYDGMGALPSLSEMATTALDILNNDPDGFFVMIEGGRIDHACHENDLLRLQPEVVEFSNTVQEVVDWVNANSSWEETLVIVTADHETGGLTFDSTTGEATWTVGDHTAANVPIYTKGAGSDTITGILDNTDIFWMTTCAESVSFQQNVNDYQATVDTNLLESTPDTAYGDAASLTVDADEPASTGQQAEALLRFDDIFGEAPGQIPPDAQIISASLELNVTNPSPGITLHRMLQSWSENATWNSLAAGILADNMEAVATADASTGTVEVGSVAVDVTASLHAWQLDPSSNYGWVMLPTATDGVDVDSSEGTVPPKLSVTYSIPDPSQHVSSFGSTLDTNLLESDPSTPYQDAVSLNVDGDEPAGTGNAVQGLIRFDGIFGDGPAQIPLDADINSARLELYVTNPGDEFVLHRMLQDWDGDDTWESLDGGVQADGTEATVLPDASTGTVASGLLSISVTTSVQAWQADPTANFGWAMLPTGLDGVDVDSSEGTIPPRLVVTYTSTDPNTSPVAADDAYAVEEDGILEVDVASGVLNNDSDAEGDAITAVLANSVSHGVLVLAEDGSFTYAPNADFSGTDSFTYMANDGNSDGNIATVSITVNPVNDAPFVANPIGWMVVDEDAADSVFDLATVFGDADLAMDDDALTWTVQSNSSESLVAATIADGILTLAYQANQSGEAMIVIRATDAGDLFAEDTVSLTVNPVNDAPSAGDDAAEMLEDTSLNVDVLANDFDEEGDPLTITVLSSTHGTATANDNATPDDPTDDTVDFTPAPGFNGAAGFTYRVNDGQLDSNAATVSITVTGVNDPPIAVDDAASTLEDVPVSVDVLANDADPENDPLTILLLDSTGGAATVNDNATPADPTDDRVEFTPAPDFNGGAGFTYQLNDGQLDSGVVTVTIDVTAVNDAPQFLGGANQVVAEDAGPQSIANWATGISAGPSDEAGQSLTFEIDNDNPELFAVAPAISEDGTLSFTSAPDANGVATITVRLADDGGTANGGADTSAPQAFSISVDAVNDAPTVHAPVDDIAVDEDAVDEVMNLWDVFDDVDDAALLLAVVGNSDSSLLSADVVDGVLTLEFLENQNGTATVRIRATDSSAAYIEDEFVITVIAVNDAPVVVTPIADVTVDQDAAPSVLDLSAVFDDPDILTNNDALTLSVSGNDNPVLVTPVMEGGTLTLTYAAGQSGIANITVLATDSLGASMEETLLVTVNSGAIDSLAVSETTVSGSVVGDNHLEATYADDDVYEAIQEELYGGKRSRLEHTWEFDVPGGDAVTFFVEAYHDSAIEDFVFDYSTDGLTWTTMLTVQKTSDDNECQTFLLPAATTGTVIVRVTDTDRSKEPELDTVYIDEMFIRSEGGSDLPVVTINATDASASEDGLDGGMFTITRTGATVGNLVVNYTIGGTATAGDDYATLSGSVTIADGETLATITIAPVDDAVEEDSETVTLSLTADAGYDVGAQNTGTVTILDNDAVTLPIVTIEATDADASEDGPDAGTLTVTRTGATTGELVVRYTIGGTATAGDDYATLSGSVTIADGETSATITIAPVDDAVEEGNETVVLTLTADAAYVVGSQAADTVTILDDDLAAVDDRAIAESSVEGSVEGTLENLQASDNSYEILQEAVVAKGQGKSELEYWWTFDVTGGSTVTFYVEAYRDQDAVDEFAFEYSVDGETWITMLTVTKTADDDQYQMFELPATTSGTTYVRVIDTNRANGETTMDTLYIDDMFFRSE